MSGSASPAQLPQYLQHLILSHKGDAFDLARERMELLREADPVLFRFCLGEIGELGLRKDARRRWDACAKKLGFELTKSRKTSVTKGERWQVDGVELRILDVFWTDPYKGPVDLVARCLAPDGSVRELSVRTILWTQDEQRRVSPTDSSRTVDGPDAAEDEAVAEEEAQLAVPRARMAAR